MDVDPPRWLEQEEQESWNAFAYLLTQLPAALETQMHRDAGLTHFEYMVLAALSSDPEDTLRLSRIAHYTGATLTRLSNVVIKLEKRGLLHRSPDPDDGRATRATLTDRGRAALTAAAPGHVAEVRRLVFDPLTAAQQRQLRAISERILRAIDPDRP